MTFYHYESEAAGRLIEQQGYRIARRGERIELSCPLARQQEDGALTGMRSVPGA
jgi:hypothetical protein